MLFRSAAAAVVDVAVVENRSMLRAIIVGDITNAAPTHDPDLGLCRMQQMRTIQLGAMLFGTARSEIKLRLPNFS